MPLWTRITASLVFAAGDVWSLATWMWESRLRILEQIGPPEYAALITLFTGGLIAINYSWINRLRPSVRLSGLTNEIQEVLIQAHPPAGGSSVANQAVARVNRAALAKKLKRLGIWTPSVSYNPAWPAYLEELLLHAKLGRIRDARELGATEKRA